jgi:CheY-like chemotaxis protein
MNEHQLVKPIEILLVEDNIGDADLVREGLESCKILNRLNVVEDGEKAIAYLHKEAPYANASRPELILLDLNLPRKDGREVLAEIKNDKCLMRIPVIILTSSKAEEDIVKSYNLHANCYISKPIDVDQFLKVIKSIEDFWLNIVILPSGGRKNGAKT